MKQIRNRQKPVVQPRNERPREVINLRKVNRASKKKWFKEARRIRSGGTLV
jgi:hypothetical protein